MNRTLATRIAAAAAGLVLASAAAAAAVDSPPDAADKGLSTAEEHTGFSVPASKGDRPGAPAGESDDGGGGRKDNHGAAVSAVAKDHSLTGREHGKAVSEVARSDAGKSHAAEDDDDGESGDERGGAGKAKGHGERGPGNGRGHNKP